jgi:hypothetical protein
MRTDEMTELIKLRRRIYKRIGILQKLSDEYNINGMNESQIECLVRISELRGVLTEIGGILVKKK